MSHRKPLWVLSLLIFAAWPSEGRAQARAGGEFQASTYATGYQYRPALVLDATGNFVVVWSSYGQDGSGTGIFGQRFGAAGARLGGEFRVNSYTTSGQYRTAAAAHARTGTFVVVWSSYGQDGSGHGIFGQRFAASGARLGGEFQVNTHTTNFQYRPAVATDVMGNFVVAWASLNQDGNNFGIFGQRFDAAGAPVGGEFQANTHTTDRQYGAAVATDATGNFIVFWTSLGQDGSSDGIFSQRFQASGARVGGEFQVNTYTPNRQYGPSAAVDARGNFVVVWTSLNQDGHQRGAFGQRFDASGARVGVEFLVNVQTTSAQAVLGQSVASDMNGGFVVSWSGLDQDGSSWGMFGRRFAASGAPRVSEFQINTYTVNAQVLGCVASDSSGNFVVAWSSNSQDGSGYGVFGQRFGGLLPAELFLDVTVSPSSNGNGVFEPGETVTVIPGWRNLNGSSQTFTGGASSFSGPPGAVYTLVDATADHGTAVNGAVGSCAATGDCYSLGVSMPLMRPVLHWDATVREDLLPDAQGQTKNWALHMGDSFTDVGRSNIFYRFVETLLHNRITGGCGGSNYCPSSSTTRDQMAVFVLVAKEGAGYAPPACTTPMFGDVPAASPFCRWIEELARRGVTGGCGGGNYCPSDAVTREQMAVFVLRTLDPALNPPACAPPNTFADVPETSGFCRWIEELARRGVVSGCGGGNYCPAQPVTREEMSVFISVTFGLALYGP